MAIELSRSGSSAILTLNRPEALNALSFQILRDIGAALDAVAAQSDVRALLVVGAGDKAFCAGALIKELRHFEVTQAIYALTGQIGYFPARRSVVARTHDRHK